MSAGDIGGRVRRRAGDERGFVGGYEALPFGFLVLVVGTLLLVDAWAVVDAKLAVTASAREATRSFVESAGPTAAEADAEARRAALEVVVAHRGHAEGVEVTTEGPLRFERCASVTFVVSQRVALINLPWIGGIGPGGVEVRARHREVVDPYRDDVPDRTDGFGPGPCDG